MLMNVEIFQGLAGELVRVEIQKRQGDERVPLIAPAACQQLIEAARRAVAATESASLRIAMAASWDLQTSSPNPFQMPPIWIDLWVVIPFHSPVLEALRARKSTVHPQTGRGIKAYEQRMPRRTCRESRRTSEKRARYPR